MSNEELLQVTLETVMPAFHVVLNGEPEAAAVYRENGVSKVFESDVPIITAERFQIYVYQKDYKQDTVNKVLEALFDARFRIENLGAQFAEGEYYRDEINVSRRKHDE